MTRFSESLRIEKVQIGLIESKAIQIIIYV